MVRMVVMVEIGDKMVVAPTTVETADQEVKQSPQKALDMLLIIGAMLEAIFIKHSKYF